MNIYISKKDFLYGEFNQSVAVSRIIEKLKREADFVSERAEDILSGKILKIVSEYSDSMDQNDLLKSDQSNIIRASAVAKIKTAMRELMSPKPIQTPKRRFNRIRNLWIGISGKTP